MKRAGFYIVKDQFFQDMNEPYLKGNKEQNRPHYYCIEDKVDGIFWMIPLSSRVDKYQRIVWQRAKQKRTCDIIHIAKLDNGKESAFLIADMFPITEEYIEREYTINGKHMRVTSEQLEKTIERKARKVLGMLKRGVKFTPTQADIKKMYEKMLKIRDEKNIKNACRIK